MAVSVTCVLAQNHTLVFSQTEVVLIEQLQNSLSSGQPQKQNERAEQNDLAPPGSSTLSVCATVARLCFEGHLLILICLFVFICWCIVWLRKSPEWRFESVFQIIGAQQRDLHPLWEKKVVLKAK